jgi:hypothetical protein
MPQGGNPVNIDVSFHRILIEIIVTYILLSVFVICAIQFALMLIGIAKPDATTRRYLFSVFGISVLGLLIGGATDFLRPNVQQAATEIRTGAERTVSAQISQGGPLTPDAMIESNGGKAVTPTAQPPITIFTQIGSNSDRAKFSALKNTLAGKGYLLPGAEAMNSNIPNNLIKYCNPANAQSALDLKKLLDGKGFNPFEVVAIPAGKCDLESNRNILEVWLQSGQ